MRAVKSLASSKTMFVSIGLLFVSAGAVAHDFWLVPDAFQLASGTDLRVRGQTSSSFPTSESAVTPDRVTEARLIGARETLAIRNLAVSGNSLILRHRPASAGQFVVTTTLAPRVLRASGPGFKRYMELEGAAALASRYEREGLLPKSDSITRRYAKYAKTIVEVGRGGPRAFDRTAGHVVEFVPLSDPALLQTGDTLALRLLYRGQSLPGMHVHAGVAADSAAEPGHDLSLETDESGIVRIPVEHGGVWNARTLHIVPVGGQSGVDWDSHFATIVFRVAPRRSAATDSSSVVDIVARFHAALERGDSSSALALLTPDVLVLESGGVETRQEYRDHHLRADIEFARAVASQRTIRRVVVRDDVAWVAGTSSARGEFRGRQINSAGAELMLLVRGANGWRISAIHWSSRQRS